MLFVSKSSLLQALGAGNQVGVNRHFTREELSHWFNTLLLDNIAILAYDAREEKQTGKK